MVKKKKKVADLEWYVFRYNMNSRRIETFNIFEHISFCKHVDAHVKECTARVEFAGKVRRELFYYYCSKAEHEVIISPWVGGDRDKDSIKVDIYSQVMMNWDKFIDYVCSELGVG